MTGIAPVAERHVRRFDRTDRILHACLMFSFLGLAITGMPLFFSHARWAAAIAHAVGGFGVTGTLHRVFAVILMSVFAAHVGRIVLRVARDKDYGVLWGPSSMVPQPRDVTDLVQHLRWFVGAGERPKFDRFTYWEKFDYWAVFWGMGIIGGSGLLLWFPELFARLVPGWVFNIAMLVHGEEALLAVGFIFLIHFFNGHLRPEKFPMDLVIFTGAVRASELRHERPAEYDRLVATGAIDDLAVPPPTPQTRTLGRVVGTIAVSAGLAIVALILYALVIH